MTENENEQQSAPAGGARTGGVAVVTGAGGGIGEALVHRFVADGMAVVAADVDEDRVSEVAGAAAGEVLAVGVDVADAASVEALATAAYDAFGAVHVLCNNAGVFQGGMLWECSAADWEWCLGVNLNGVIHGITSFVPRMLDGGAWGHIVNTASVAAWIHSAGTGPYNVAKAAVFTLTETLANELADTPIGVSVLTPGSTRTGIGSSERSRPAGLVTEQAPTAVAMNQGLAAMVAEGADPGDVADVVAEGIDANRFLIPTKPSFSNQLDTRYQALLEQRVPPLPVVD